MTNPPFYTSAEELISLAQNKSRPPNSACTGAPVEMIYPAPVRTAQQSKDSNLVNEGGEVGFVGKIITESLHPELKTKIQWFSSMLGKLSSVSIIIGKLRDVGCKNYAVGEFVNRKERDKVSSGGRTSTRRWVVAWSWMSFRPDDDIVRATDAVSKSLLSGVTRYETALDGILDGVATKLDEIVCTLETESDGLEWRWKDKAYVGIGRSMKGDVWSRAARRKRKLNSHSADDNSMAVDEDEDEEEEEQEPAFVFKIKLESISATTTPNSSSQIRTKVIVRWLQGHEAKIFESFCGWLKRKMREEMN